MGPRTDSRGTPKFIAAGDRYGHILLRNAKRITTYGRIMNLKLLEYELHIMVLKVFHFLDPKFGVFSPET